MQNRRFSNRTTDITRPDWLLTTVVLVVWLLATVFSSLLVAIVLPNGELISLRNTLLPLMFTHLITWGMLWKILSYKGARVRVGFINFRRTSAWLILAGMAVHLLLSLLLVGMTYFLPLPLPPINPIKQLMEQGLLETILVALAVVLMAPLLEETLFRGLLQGSLRSRFSFPLTVVLVSLIFAILHILSFGLYWPAIIVIFVASLILCYLRERHKSLWSPIFFHAGFNLLAFLILLVNKFIAE